MANGNFGGGDGTTVNPYLVEDAADMDAIRENTSFAYKQVADINMSSISNFTPIPSFSGIYDGGNKIIKNLSIDTTQEQAGLFATAEQQSYFKNMIITDSNVNGFKTTGTMAGTIRGSVENCHVSNAVVTNKATSYPTIGGFAGRFNSLNAKNCSFDGSVIAVSASDAGGFCGQIGTSTVVGCKSRGSVSGTSTQMGGFAGGYAGTGAYTDISFCESHARVSVNNGSFSGGFAGRLIGDFKVSDCYCTGSVTGSAVLGGFAGTVAGPSTRAAYVMKCYSSGSVSYTGSAASPNIGGFVGKYDGSASLKIENCYTLCPFISSFSSTHTNINRFIGIYTGSGVVTSPYALSTMELR